MIYSELIKKAINIAYEAHKDQVDKGGYPYILHPLHIAEQMDTEYETIVAILHDVVEDTDVSLYLLSKQFPAEIIEALKLLTHNTYTPYMQYIHTLKENKIAAKVKIADLKHNLDNSRLYIANSKQQLYIQALNILEEK